MNVLDFIVWLVIFLIIAGIILVVSYWISLFRARDSFGREELIDFYSIILGELERLTAGNPAGSIISMLAGVCIAWLLTLLGGWFSPSAPGIPDYASALATNYFFQSILFIGVLHLVWPSLQDYAYDYGGPDGILARLVRFEVPFFFTLGSGLAAVALMNWGLYHKMNFLICLGNAISCAGYAGLRVFSYDPQANPDPYSDPYSDEYAGGYTADNDHYDEGIDLGPDDNAAYDTGDDIYGEDDYRRYDTQDLGDAPEI